MNINPFDHMCRQWRDVQFVPPPLTVTRGGLQEKFTDAEAETIKRLFKRGMIQKDIAREVSRSESAIGKYMRSQGLSTGKRKRRGLDVE